MAPRLKAVLFAAVFLNAQIIAGSATAENQMGYQILPSDQATQLPRGGGTLGMKVGRGQVITDSGLTFELLHVDGVRRGSAGDRAGLKAGDQVIAVDGRVFPSVATFGAYVGSKQPGEQISIDYIPAGGGPQQAQRVSVRLGSNEGVSGQQALPQAQQGLSTGTKVAIGVGAAALFGCYKLGCFSHRNQAGQDRQQPGVTTP